MSSELKEDIQTIINKLRLVNENPSFYSDEEVDKIMDIGTRALEALQEDQDEDVDVDSLDVNTILEGLGRSPVVRKQSRYTDSIEVMMDIVEKESNDGGDA